MQKLSTQEVIQRVRRIEIKARGITKEVLSGQYKSAFKGRGMTFSEVREYQSGDDVRSIDWNVTARMDAPYLKIYEEERELTTMLLVDISGSLDFGSSEETKRMLVTELAATLAFSCIENSDKIGLILFSDKVELYLPPGKGRKHVLHLITKILTYTPESKDTDPSVAIAFAQQVIKKRATLFVISDFMADIERYENPIRMIAKKHDVVAMRICDRREESIPNVGWVRFFDIEKGTSKWINTASRKIRKSYQENQQEWALAIDKMLNSCGIDYCKLYTGVDFIPTLMRLFGKRS